MTLAEWIAANPSYEGMQENSNGSIQLFYGTASTVGLYSLDDYIVSSNVSTSLMLIPKIVSNIPVGEIFEIIDNGNVASGRFYRRANHDSIIGKITCLSRYSGLKVNVHPELRCKTVHNVEGF